MYELVLVIHNAMRWVVLATALLAVSRALVGWFGPRPWTPADSAAGRWFVAAASVQFVIGLLLYAFLSPITQTAFGDMATAMRTSAIRFWAVEHLTMMFLALGLAHVGAAKVKKALRDGQKHRAAGIFYALSLVLTLAGIPWMGTNARPLFRWFE